MCGRYASSRGAQDLAEAFGARDGTAGELTANYNVAPTDAVPAILVRPDPDRPEQYLRRLQLLRWGLIPSWATSAKIGAKMINARAETLAEKPAYRKAFAARRCLLPADGYYEWTREGGHKQPYFHTPADGSLLVMAGLYEVWRAAAHQDRGCELDPDSPVWSCTVITTTAPDDLGHIHDRSPMVLDPGDWASWLDPRLADPQRLTSLLRPAVAGQLAVWPVSRDVNKVGNNHPGLVDPVALQPPGSLEP